MPVERPAAVLNVKQEAENVEDEGEVPAQVLGRQPYVQHKK